MVLANHIVGIIPARYASTRFPGKPLADIAGKSMIARVYERASMAAALNYLVVATDDERIAQAVKQFGGNYIFTNPNHQSGTDRIIEVMQHFPDSTYFINIQGDEPFINPKDIEQVVGILKDTNKPCVATLASPIRDSQMLFQENSVKVVLDKQKQALYFSRSPIPFSKDPQKLMGQNFFLKHIGLYGYHRISLQEISQLPVSELEKAESLEQLRWLEAGIPIRVGITENHSTAIDVPEDIQRAILNHQKEL